MSLLLWSLWLHPERAFFIIAQKTLKPFFGAAWIICSKVIGGSRQVLTSMKLAYLEI